jgi:hypothetical protein
LRGLGESKELGEGKNDISSKGVGINVIGWRED